MPDTTAPDPVTAYLAAAEAQAAYEQETVPMVPGAAEGSAEYCVRLVAAVRAALALADDWAAQQGDGPDGIAIRACGIRVRSVIAAELPGEDGTPDGS